MLVGRIMSSQVERIRLVAVGAVLADVVAVHRRLEVPPVLQVVGTHASGPVQALPALGPPPVVAVIGDEPARPAREVDRERKRDGEQERDRRLPRDPAGAQNAMPARRRASSSTTTEYTAKPRGSRGRST